MPEAGSPDPLDPRRQAGAGRPIYCDRRRPLQNYMQNCRSCRESCSTLFFCTGALNYLNDGRKSQAVGYAASVFQPGTWPAAARSLSLSQSCLHLAVAALVAALVATLV
jgi:hypothetical protein